jgi:two-component system OmpR family response regulator
VLVVEDEDPIRDLVMTALRFTGYEVEGATSGLDALRRIGTGGHDLVILDVNLPDMDGFTVCRKARAEGAMTPVIFLTARDDPADLRAGFTGGGDDYITKPFSLDEVIARIHAVLRRQHGPGPAPAARLTFADLELDPETYEVWRSGERIALSPTEFKLLRYFMANPGRVLSKAQILDHVWDYDFRGDSGIVETYIHAVRRKIGEPRARLIHTLRGVGYVLRPPS